MSMNQLPNSFKPILWSYDFEKIDPQNDKKTVVVNTINYGSLDHWKWIKDFYGEKEIRNLLENIPRTEFRKEALGVASILFKVTKHNDQPRSIIPKE
jgi:hypothetical protein